MVAVMAFANAAVLLYKVPIMEATGLSLAAASGLAGLRGAFQLPGRLVLSPLVRPAGVRGLIGGCYLLSATAIGALLLALGGGGVSLLVV